jgi:hypothetical protein
VSDASAHAETTALVEAGPRSIRPAGLPGLVMLELVSRLVGDHVDASVRTL